MAYYSYDRKGWGARLRKHAEDTHFDWEKAIEALGLKGDSGLRHWLNGTRSPKLKTFFRLRELTKADPQFILFGGAGPAGQSPQLKSRRKERSKATA